MIKDKQGFIKSINYSELLNLSSSWDTLKNVIPNLPEVAKEYETILKIIVSELYKRNVPQNTPLNIGILSQVSGEDPEKIAFAIIYLDQWQYLPKSKNTIGIKEINNIINYWHTLKSALKNLIPDYRLANIVSRITNLKTRIEIEIKNSKGNNDRVNISLAEETVNLIFVDS